MKTNIRLFVPNTTEALDFEYGLVIHYMQNNDSKKGHAIGLQYYELAEIEPVNNALDIVEQKTLTEVSRNQSKIDGFTLDSHYALSFDQRFNNRIDADSVRQVWLWLHCKNSTEYPFLLEKTTDTQQKILSQQNQFLVRVWAHADWIEYETQPLAQHQQALLSTLQQSLSVYFNQIEQANRQKVLVELKLKTVPIDEPNPTVVETVVDNQNPTVAETLTDNQNSTSDVQSISTQKKISRTAWIVVLCVIFTIALLSVAPLKEKFMFFNDGDLNSKSVVTDYQQAEISKINNDISEIKEGLQELRERVNFNQSTPLWKTILFTVLSFFGLAIFYLLLRISTSKQLEAEIDELKQRSDQNTKRLVSESAKKQAEHLKHAFADIEQLKQQVQQLRQLQQQPALSGGRQYEAGLDYPTLRPTASVIPHQQTIDEQDCLALQQAFLEWRANSSAKKMTDCLPSSFLQKVKALDYEIVFAKAGVGLERMIIDRKPPSSTRMVGLTSHSHSIMYCYEYPHQGSENWTPNTWYEVSIDAPDSADEQTVHQLEELCR